MQRNYKKNDGRNQDIFIIHFNVKRIMKGECKGRLGISAKKGEKKS
jgi:hypothetical protein